MMRLLILYGVGSERELLAAIPERLDWLWFLGFNLDDEAPNPNVLSKVRARWGTKRAGSGHDSARCIFEPALLTTWV